LAERSQSAASEADPGQLYEKIVSSTLAAKQPTTGTHPFAEIQYYDLHENPTDKGNCDRLTPTDSGRHGKEYQKHHCLPPRSSPVCELRFVNRVLFEPRADEAARA
jgi:hypothetical protein